MPRPLRPGARVPSGRARRRLRKSEVDAAIAGEQAKTQAAIAADTQRRASIKATWAAERGAAQDVVAAASQAQQQILALEVGKRTAAAATSQAQRQQAVEAVSAGRELVLAASQNHRQLAAIEGQTGAAQQERFLATRSAMEIEIAEAGELGQAYVRVRLVQETQSREMKQLGGTVAQSMKPGKAAVDDTSSSVDSLGKMFLKLQLVNQVAGWVRDAMQAVGHSIQAAREHVKGLVDEMEQARTASRELAALRGEKASGMFTGKLARSGRGGARHREIQRVSARLPGVHRPVRRQERGDAGGAPGRRPETEQRAGRRAPAARCVVFRGARGLSADDSSKLLGTVVAKSHAGASNDQIMSEYAKLMKIMELAPGKTSPLIGQLSEVGMESVGPEGDFKNLQQAGYLTRVMAQRNPNEASTYSRAMLRGLREIGGSDEKRGELGITKDMDVMQQLEQVNVKAQEHVAGGGKEGEFIQKYFPEIREWGAVKTALNEGIRGGGFQRAQAEAASVDSGTADAETRQYKGGREGVAARQRSELLATDRERAAQYEPLKQRQRDAAIALHGSGELEMPENVMNAMLTGSGSMVGMGDREKQQVNKLTATNLNQGLMGYGEGRQYLSDKYGHDRMGGGRDIGAISGSAPEHEMAEAARLLERLAKAAEATRERGDVPTQLVAPPQARGGVRH